ncbi:MAG: hypothetical protein ABL971_11850 [Vicinamibacterales bacterium]
MRDLLAAVVAVVLVVAALSLATSLTYTRLRRRRSADSERARGRTIIAELPIGEDLTLVSEDATHFHYGEQAIAKDSILAARVLVNGSPIAAAVSKRVGVVIPQPTSFEDRPEGIARDRWDVAVETENGTVLMECGAIRERVSQELARKIFDRVKASLD